MDFKDIEARGLVILGCGKMGSAMLKGWLSEGLSPKAVHVQDPYPSEWVESTGVNVNGALPEAPALVLIAVKPQMMSEALPSLQEYGGGGTLFVSVAAGTSLVTYGQILGLETPVIRAMPNTPAAIGQGDYSARGIAGIDGRAYGPRGGAPVSHRQNRALGA